MTRNAIEIEGLGKRYRLGEDFARYLTIRESLERWIRGNGRSGGRKQEIWALRDLGLTIEEGSALGVIGRNGAGKSTLLKILARVVEPTTGVARMRGRVGALLEVGTGFHPELTGRENVYLNGAILGMSRREIARRFDEIVEFAGVERFLDTPLKRYSSGMNLRLAFAVAAHLEPPIMIVDEVLAVGDAEFQRKCLGKMSELGQGGRTVVFVSHDLGAIRRLCQRTVWLDKGVVQADGPSGDVVDEYLRSGLAGGARTEFELDPAKTVQLLSVAITDEAGRELQMPRRDEPFCISVRVLARERVRELDLAISLLNQQGRVTDDSWKDDHDYGLADGPGEYEVSLTIPPVLTPGDYRIAIWVGTEYDTYVDQEAASFQLWPRPNDPQEQITRQRVVAPTVDWRVTPLSAQAEPTDRAASR